MNKTIKILMKVMPVMMLLVIGTTTVFGLSPELPTGGTAIEGVTGVANNIWQTVSVILQILAFAAIILAGVRYMFSSPEKKADIKGESVAIIIGAVLVFAGPTIIKFIQTTSQSIFGGN